MLMIFIGCELFVVLSCPYIWINTKKYRRVRSLTERGEQQVINGSGTSITVKMQEMAEVDEKIRPRLAANVSRMQQSVNRPPGEKRQQKFLFLTLLTGSIFVCWTPANVYFTIPLFIHFHMPNFWLAANAMYALQNILDPLFLFIAMPDLHAVILPRCLRFRP